MTAERDDEIGAVVRRQRACRDFSDDAVDDRDIADLLEAATFAPSAENKQPWEFVVVRDGTARRRIGELATRIWEGGGREFSRGRSNHGLFSEVDAALSSGFASAPVVIVVCADTEKVLDGSVASSIFPAIQNLLLTATSLGLGSALTTISTLIPDELSSAIGLPDHVTPVAVIPIGHPARPLRAPRREPFSDHAHRDTFGNPW